MIVNVIQYLQRINLINIFVNIPSYRKSHFLHPVRGLVSCTSQVRSGWDTLSGGGGGWYHACHRSEVPVLWLEYPVWGLVSCMSQSDMPVLWLEYPVWGLVSCMSQVRSASAVVGIPCLCVWGGGGIMHVTGEKYQCSGWDTRCGRWYHACHRSEVCPVAGIPSVGAGIMHVTVRHASAMAGIPCVGGWYHHACLTSEVWVLCLGYPVWGLVSCKVVYHQIANISQIQFVSISTHGQTTTGGLAQIYSLSSDGCQS